MKVTEKKLADGVIKLDCEATAIEVNNALKEAAEAFALSMGVRPMPGKSRCSCPGRSTAATSCRRSRPRPRPR